MTISSTTQVPQSQSVSSTKSDNQIDSSFDQLLTSSSDLLTTAELSRQSRPTVGAFMSASGLEFNDAKEILYGVIGSNTDLRNWSAILSSKDPATAARAATNAMYNSNENYYSQSENDDDNFNLSNLTSEEKPASNGNFSLIKTLNEAGDVAFSGVALVDSQGSALRVLGDNAESIAQNAWWFGFDTSSLANLAEPAKAISQPLSNAMLKAPFIDIDNKPNSAVANYLQSIMSKIEL